MTDDRHAPDTFFLVAEADWRLYRDHCVADRDWMAEVDIFAKEMLLGSGEPVDSYPAVSPAAPMEQGYKPPESDTDDRLLQAFGAGTGAEMLSGAAASSSGGPGLPRPERPGSPAPEEEAPQGSEKSHSFYGWVKPSRPEGEAYIARDLRDLIQIANQAHRYHGKGDVVWYSWSGKGKAKNRPSYGSTLLGVSKAGAQKLKQCMEHDNKPIHFDIWLKDKLYKKAHDLQGVYVYPAVGGFDEHLSGCDPTGAGPDGRREALWDQKNQVGGVRITTPTADHSDRYVRAFLDTKGHPDGGVKVEFGDDADTSLVWRTLRPPSHYWLGDKMWHDILYRRGGLTWNGWLSLPTSLTAPPGHHDWRTLEAQPDEYPWNKVSKCVSPITRLADHVVTTHLDDADMAMITKRQKTEIRLNLTMYKKRFFVDDQFQAA